MENGLEEAIKAAGRMKYTGRVPGTDYFFKSRVSLLKSNSRYGDGQSKNGGAPSIEDEYNALSEVHKIIPKNSPKPVALIRGINGAPKGYLMTTVPGKSLEGQLYISDAARGELSLALSELHKNGIAHGDLRTKNIRITDNSVYLIDPSGQSCQSDTYQQKFGEDEVFGSSILNAFQSREQIRETPYRMVKGVINRLKYSFNARVAYHLKRSGSKRIDYLK